VVIVPAWLRHLKEPACAYRIPPLVGFVAGTVGALISVILLAPCMVLLVVVDSFTNFSTLSNLVGGKVKRERIIDCPSLFGKEGKHGRNQPCNPSS
jgi:hypothetical protein